MKDSHNYYMSWQVRGRSTINTVGSNLFLVDVSIRDDCPDVIVLRYDMSRN